MELFNEAGTPINKDITDAENKIDKLVDSLLEKLRESGMSVGDIQRVGYRLTQTVLTVITYHILSQGLWKHKQKEENNED